MISINVPKNATFLMESTGLGDVYIKTSDEVARLVYNEVAKRFFKQDFLNFLQTQHSKDVKAIDMNAYHTWDRLWNSYQKHEDMTVSIWDTFETVLQDVWEYYGSFTCCSCGKKLLDALPVADCNGNCFCEHCADAQTDFCEECGERHLKSELTYVEDGVAYCEHCKEEYIND